MRLSREGAAEYHILVDERDELFLCSFQNWLDGGFEYQIGDFSMGKVAYCLVAVIVKLGERGGDGELERKRR